MITPSFGLTATERVLPKLALDFTTAALDSRVTFTRTTGASNPATYTNNSGVITTATNNQPRFDYDPVTLACKGLLIEESRTNLFQQSNTLDNVYWTKGPLATMTGSSGVSPDGTNDSYKLAETTASGQFYFQKIQTISNTTAYTLSVYAKAAERNWLVLYSSNPTASAYFDLTNGVVGNTSGSPNPTIISVGNGWYRCTITTTSTSTSAIPGIQLASANGTVSYSGTLGNGLLVFGMQYEQGAFATSYIPTTSAALTRNADAATMTGTNFSDWYNQSEGTMQIIGDPVPPTASGFGMTAGQIYQASGNYVSISMGVAKRPRLLVYTGGSLVLNASASSDISAPLNQVAALKSGSISFASNATAIATNSAQNIPTSMISFGIGYDIFNARGGNIWVQKVNYWPMKITNAETLAFSK